ncbi:MAG: hypothetical protein PHY45_02820 [Rhodocyclaceae bacterium]|nr:hypothetical protein [Rhodocyclaceae bacterium]
MASLPDWWGTTQRCPVSVITLTVLGGSGSRSVWSRLKRGSNSGCA